MGSLTLLYWIALLLPGYALVRLFAPDNVREGLPGVIAISMLGAFALLSPINIIGHTFEAPLWIFSATVLLLIVASVIFITKRRWWRDIRSLLIAAVSIELLVLAVDLVLSARAGSFMIGDAVIHLSRISLLGGQGMTNGHPFFGGEYFFPTYHTNILHALMASCGQLTPFDHLEVWWAARPLGAMLAIGGTYQLAWTVFRRHWPAWAAALFVLGMRGSLPYLIYPNQLAALWLAPLILSFVIEAARSPVDWKPIVKIAVTSLVLGQMHGLYAVFAAILLSPVLGILLVSHLLKRQARQALIIGACCAALAPGLAFPLVSVAHTNSIGHRLAAIEDESVAPTAAANAADDPASLNSRLGIGFSRYWWRPLLVAALSILLFMNLKTHRRELIVLFGVFLVAAALLWIPPIYQIMLRLLREEWIIARMEFIFRLLFALLVAGGAVALFQHWIESHSPHTRANRWRIAPWRVAALVMIPLGAYTFSGDAQFSWPHFFRQASAAQSIQCRNLAWMHTVQSFVKQNIQPGSRVLCPPALGMLLTAVHDCSIVAGATNNLGVPNAQDRLADQREMLSDRTSDPQREQLLDEYDVQYVVFIAQPRQWALRAAEVLHQRRIPAVQWNLSIIELPDDDAHIQRR